MNRNTDICQICLRTDKKLKIIDEKLFNFHDELCDYGVTYNPHYCTYCEYLLRKAYKFKAKCLMANKILKDQKNTKPFNELYTLLPRSALGTWKEANAHIYNYCYEEMHQPMPTTNGNMVHTTVTDDVKFHEEESLYALPFNENNVKLEDPLMIEDDIKTEEIEATLVEEREAEEIVEIEANKVNTQEVKPKNNLKATDVNRQYLTLEREADNWLEEKWDYVENIDQVLLNEIDELLKTEPSDDDSVSSNDNCVSDVFDEDESNQEKMEQETQTPNKNMITYGAALLDHDYGEWNSEASKKPLELTNISLIEGDNIHNNNNNGVVKKYVRNKVVRGKVMKKTNCKQLSNAIKVEVMKTGKQIINSKRSKKGMDIKMRLINELVRKFDNCGELTTEDGTVLNKQRVLVALRHENTLKNIRDLLKNVWGKPVLTKEVLNQLKILQTANDEYLKVFDMLYLNTEEEILEEFEKRKTYKVYLDAPFKCEHCHQWFDYKKNLEYHMKWHDVKVGDAVCPICKARRNKKGYWKHVALHKSVYKCKLCPLITNYRNVMISHYQKHEGVQHTCKYCSKTFGNYSVARNHLTTKCKGTVHIPCTLCGLTFFSAAGLRIHNSHKHAGEPPVEENPDTTCSICSLTFASVEVYHKHMKISHNKNDNRKEPPKRYDKKRKRPKPRVFTCRVCNAKGSTYGWLTSHFLSEHPNVNMSVLYLDKVNHLCDICGKAYAQSSGLRNHMNFAHLDNRPYPCDQCPKRFSCKLHLNNHKYYHGPPTFECRICEKKFRSPTNLSFHMRTHIGDRRYKCQLCGKGFLSTASLKGHVQGVHENLKRVKKRVTRNSIKSEEESS